MAHGFLQSLSSQIIVCSAGTNPAPQINEKAITVMKEVGIDISSHKPEPVEKYLDEEWDYVITVCDNAKETCPAFVGKVSHRLHIGFEDPSKLSGDDEFIWSEFRRIRDEIREGFKELFIKLMRI